MLRLHRCFAPCAFLFFLLLFGSAFADASESQAQNDDSRRAVLVTGASSGIGLRMTEVLSENGFFVYATARDADDLARLDAMEGVKAIRLDVRYPDQIRAAAEAIRAEGRGLYGLVNNAGVATMGPMIEMPEEDLAFQLDVNLMGPFRVTQAFADLIIESRGRILTVGSIAGIVTGPFGGAYSMSKHGVEAFTDALAAEMARFDVRVAVVEPGNYRSQILASMVDRMKTRGYSPEGSRFGSMLDLVTGPLDRSQHKEPDEVAQAALDFLTAESPKARYMVVPNEFEASLTIRQAIRELAQLNERQAYTYDRNELVAMLDEALGYDPKAEEDRRQNAEDDRDPKSADDQMATIGIHEAALAGNLAAINRFIETGADLDEKDPMGGSSPLIIASTFGRTEVARALIEAGADLDQTNSEGSTALLTAALFCREDIVRALLDAGANPNIRNASGSTALDAVSGPFEDVRPVYDYLGNVLGPLGLRLDYDRLEKMRPVIARMLR